MWLLSVLCVCLYSIYEGSWMRDEVKHEKYDKYVSTNLWRRDVGQLMQLICG